jgi:VIT1/CCC1 family predicted Fe2+/Mn2+ transporter
MKNTFTKYLPQFVYGSIDGTVTTFAIVSGVSGAALSPVIILILGIANVLADGFSMASSNYLSERSKENESVNQAFKTSLATFISFILIGFIPLIPYILNLQQDRVFIFSCILTGLTFLAIGFVKGKVIGEAKVQSALETFTVGSIAAIISYLVGYYLKIFFGI